jgi:hypothetical protein
MNDDDHGNMLLKRWNAHQAQDFNKKTLSFQQIISQNNVQASNLKLNILNKESSKIDCRPYGIKTILIE